MIKVPRHQDIKVNFKSFNYGRNFEVAAIHETDGPTFRHIARIDPTFIDRDGETRLVPDFELKRRGEICANAARAGVLKKIHAHIAIINPIDND